MKKFEEWLAEKHPETVKEGWGRNLLVGGAMLGGMMGHSANAGDTGYTNYGPSRGGNFTFKRQKAPTFVESLVV